MAVGPATTAAPHIPREHSLKHIIEAWGGRYVSYFDVEVAAALLGLQGRYPFYDISSKLTRPSLSRLEGIGEAMKHRGYLSRPWHRDVYSIDEALSHKDLNKTTRSLWVKKNVKK